MRRVHRWKIFPKPTASFANSRIRDTKTPFVGEAVFSVGGGGGDLGLIRINVE